MTAAAIRDRRKGVSPIRRLLTHRRLVLLLCAATLLLKMIVPTGYMVASRDGRPVVTLCPGATAMAMAAGAMPHAMPHAMIAGGPMVHGAMPGHDVPADHDRADKPCAFAGLSAAALGAIDPILIAALIAFVLAIGMADRAAPPPAAMLRLRPPLRGPPTRR